MQSQRALASMRAARSGIGGRERLRPLRHPRRSQAPRRDQFASGASPVELLPLRDPRLLLLLLLLLLPLALSRDLAESSPSPRRSVSLSLVLPALTLLAISANLLLVLGAQVILSGWHISPPSFGYPLRARSQ